jgi:hypothetical protein
VTVYDEVENCVRSFEYSTTRAACYGYWARIDATPQVIAKAIEAQFPIVEELWHKENVRQCSDILVGLEVLVTGGRKHKSKQGLVRWIGDNQFKRYGKRVKVETAEGESFYVDDDYVQIVNPEQHMKGEVELQQYLANARSNMIYKWGHPAPTAVMIVTDIDAEAEMEIEF